MFYNQIDENRAYRDAQVAGEGPPPLFRERRSLQEINEHTPFLEKLSYILMEMADCSPSLPFATSTKFT